MMTPEEFSHYEKSINEELKNGRIVNDTKPGKKTSAKSGKSSGNSSGHWVTINGNHVLMKD